MGGCSLGARCWQRGVVVGGQPVRGHAAVALASLLVVDAFGLSPFAALTGRPVVVVDVLLVHGHLAPLSFFVPGARPPDVTG